MMLPVLIAFMFSVFGQTCEYVPVTVDSITPSAVKVLDIPATQLSWVTLNLNYPLNASGQFFPVGTFAVEVDYFDESGVLLLHEVLPNDDGTIMVNVPGEPVSKIVLSSTYKEFYLEALSLGVCR